MSSLWTLERSNETAQMKQLNEAAKWSKYNEWNRSNERAFHNRRMAAKLATRLSGLWFINVHKYVGAIRSSELSPFQLRVFQQNASKICSLNQVHPLTLMPLAIDG